MIFYQIEILKTVSDLSTRSGGEIPHGSILSVTLFSIKINHNVKALNPGGDCSLYVDFLSKWVDMPLNPSMKVSLKLVVNIAIL